MCGIVGIYYKNNKMTCDKVTLEAMRDVIAHRGPDDCGVYIDRNVGLGHRRLSIIDLESGHQPMCNENNSIWVTYNGEIYNFKEVRRELESRGHIFRTRSDTEIIVHAYEEYGLDFVKRFNGMFAFAIWDSNERKLILARDRLGIKPLYYFECDSFILFASEIKAILKYPQFKPDLNISAVKEYMIFRYISGEETLFKKIKRLLPGYMLIAEENRDARKICYWDIDSNPDFYSYKFNDAVERMDSLFSQSIDYQLISDVPVGSFCSGGIDSSLVTALGSTKVGKNMETFCVGFDLPEWDERAYAKITAQRYATKHHEIIIRDTHFTEGIEHLNWFFDEPIGHHNSVPLYYLSKYSREHVKVVLTGEGADELFAGYPRHFIVSLFDILTKVNKSLPYVIARILKIFNQRKIRKLSDAFMLDSHDSIIFNSAFNDSSIVDRIIRPEYKSDTDTYLRYRQECLSKFNQMEDLTEALIRYEVKTYLVSALDRMDKMSMAVGLEARVPFLDNNLVDFVLNLPKNFKIQKMKNKYILKKYAKRYIDDAIIERAKSGFGVPISDWFRNINGLGKFLIDLQKPSSPIYEYIDDRLLDNVIHEHLNTEIDHSELLWVLVNLNITLKTFFNK